MADVSIDASVVAVTARGLRSVVFTTRDIGYWFYFDGDGVFGYSKTTDGGATWGGQVNVDSSAATTGIAFDVWYDQWTPGDTGTKIHCWFFDVTADDILYRSLDTNGDTLGTQVLVANNNTAVAGRGCFVSGTKTRSGYLYCAFDVDAGAERDFFRSTDNGASWGTSLSSTFVEATLDQCLLFPASNTGDNNDCWAVYYDASATALTLKLWDSSAGSASESATIQTHTDGATDLTGQMGFSASVRHSDGHLILAAVSLRDNASSVHNVYDITDTATITTKGNITTNIDDHYYPQVFIDQASNTLYVAYNGKRDGSEVMDTTTKVYYTKSTDGGSNWSAGDTAYMEGAAGVVQQVWAPLMGPRFYAGWRVGTTLLGNKVNSVITPLAMVVGSLVFAGQGPNLAFATALAAGVVAFTGQSVGVAFAGPDVGAITITGQAPTIVAGGGTTIAVPAGSLAITGQGPAFQFIIDLPTGPITYTGLAPTVGGAAALAVPAGALSLTGQTVASAFLGPDVGVVTFSGAAPTVSVSAATTIAIPAGALTWSGQTPLLVGVMPLPAGLLTLTGQAPTVATSGSVALPEGGLTLIGRDVGIGFVGPDVGLLTFAGLAPTVSIGAAGSSIAVPAGALTFTGQTPTRVVAGGNIALPAGSLTLAGQYFAIAFFDPGPGQVNYTGQAPQLLFADAVPAGLLTFTGQVPGVAIPGSNVTIAVPAGALTFAGTVPSLQATTIAPVGTLTFTGQTAVVALADPLPVGALTYTGLAASLATALGLPAGALTFSGVAGSIGGAVVAVPDVGALTLSGQLPLVALVLPVPVGSLTIAGQVGSLADTHSTPIPAGALVFTGTVTAEAVTVALQAGTLVFSSERANVGFGDGADHESMQARGRGRAR